MNNNKPEKSSLVDGKQVYMSHWFTPHDLHAKLAKSSAKWANLLESMHDSFTVCQSIKQDISMHADRDDGYQDIWICWG